MKERQGIGSGIISSLLILTIMVVFSYLIVRTALFISASYPLPEKIFALLLLLAEGFILIHSIGYFLNILHVVSHKKRLDLVEGAPPVLESYPPVAIVVSSYKEPLDVLEDTLTCFYNLTYPNKRIYFLDDTRYDLQWDSPEKMGAYRKAIDDLCEGIGVNLFRRQWRGAKAGMINDFLDFIEGRRRKGFVFRSFDNKQQSDKEKYMIVFDADQNPFPDFVETLVAIMERDERLSFVQTPQYYSNFETNRVARAAGLQQAVFYEYICEGKSIKDAMFCCGTNVIFRREALMDVGGFDESSVTEDFATSLRFHLKGWHSAYLNRVCAFGMGPEDLGGYFKQQFRWALGTVGVFREILKEFFRNPLRLPLAKWWEYFLSGTHYFVGWVFLITMICPALYLFFNVPSYFARPELYLLFFSPYVVLSFSVFFWTLRQRRYRSKDLLLGLLLNAVSFPVFMKASVQGILGVRGTFGITPKGVSASLPLSSLWPQILMALVSIAAVSWGVNRLIFEREPIWGIAVNAFWCLYFFILLSAVLYFNSPGEAE